MQSNICGLMVDMLFIVGFQAVLFETMPVSNARILCHILLFFGIFQAPESKIPCTTLLKQLDVEEAHQH